MWGCISNYYMYPYYRRLVCYHLLILGFVLFNPTRQVFHPTHNEVLLRNNFKKCIYMDSFKNPKTTNSVPNADFTHKMRMEKG